MGQSWGEKRGGVGVIWGVLTRPIQIRINKIMVVVVEWGLINIYCNHVRYSVDIVSLPVRSAVEHPLDLEEDYSLGFEVF